MKKCFSNKMEMTFSAQSVNEGFARVCVASFCLQMNPSLDEISDIKTAVSEAVTNAVVHAYPNKKGMIKLSCEISGNDVTIEISDTGVGIEDIEKAREPFFTTKPSEERSGMGFAVMEGFMDEVIVKKGEGGKGTTVVLKKHIEESCQQLVGE